MHESLFLMHFMRILLIEQGKLHYYDNRHVNIDRPKSCCQLSNCFRKHCIILCSRQSRNKRNLEIELRNPGFSPFFLVSPVVITIII